MESTAQAMEDLGRCTLSPAGAVVAGAFGTWTVTYVAGSQGIAPGGGIAVMPPAPHGVRWRVGHVVASTTGAGGVSVRVRRGYPVTYHHAQFPVIFVTVEGEWLRPGEAIRVTLGDPGAFISGFYERARAQELAMRGAEWQVLVDPLGNASYSNPAYPGGQPKGDRLLAERPRVDVVAGPPRRLDVVTPSRLAPGEAFEALVTARDEHGNLCEGIEGMVEVGLTSLPGPLSTPWRGGGTAGGELRLVSGAARVTLAVPAECAVPLCVTAAV